MSNSPHEEEGSFFSSPEDVVAYMRKEQERMQLHMQDNNHAIKQLLDELNEEQLQALQLVILKSMKENGAYLLRGRIQMILQMKFDVCPCGKTHNPDEEFDQTPLPQQQAPMISHPDDAARQAEYEDRIMEEYGIELNPDYGGPIGMHEPAPQRFRCKGCGIGVASLEDRMRRKPGIDGCSGCQQKSAFG